MRLFPSRIVRKNWGVTHANPQGSPLIIAVIINYRYLRHNRNFLFFSCIKILLAWLMKFGFNLKFPIETRMKVESMLCDLSNDLPRFASISRHHRNYILCMKSRK